MGGHYEMTGAESTKYYFAGSTRIAMRKGTTLYYLLGDHLGSTSIVTDASGNKVSEMRYKAWGEVRYTWGSTPTDYQFTGQYSHQSDFGLMFYNARYYDSALGRFASADTIVPPGVQGLDKYAYASNNPIAYVDPSGHDDVPWWQIIKFFASKVIDNGKITDADWREAANTYLPAREGGSNFAAVAAVVIPPGAAIVEANYVTTANGDFQMYITGGSGAGLGAGGSVGYSQGAVNGDGFTSADAFSGTALQVAGSVTFPVVNVGGAVDGWWSVNEVNGKVFVGEVSGYDIEGHFGTPGGSVTGTVQNAVPAGEGVKNLLDLVGLADTKIGGAYLDYVNNVTSFQMNGAQLFGCRLAQQCGRWSISE